LASLTKEKFKGDLYDLKIHNFLEDQFQHKTILKKNI